MNLCCLFIVCYLGPTPFSVRFPTPFRFVYPVFSRFLMDEKQPVRK